jgi:hypothetical protein
LRHAGLQRERVQDAAHLALEGRVDQLVAEITVAA